MRAVGSGWKRRTALVRPPLSLPQPPQAPFHSVHTPPPREDRCPEFFRQRAFCLSGFLVNGLGWRVLV